MIAVVKVAGQQFKVEKDQTLYVPRLEGKAGDKIDLEVLLADAGGKLTAGTEVKAKVKAEIVDQEVKGDTVIAYKQKRRKGFHKKRGHRTVYTKIKVTSIA